MLYKLMLCHRHWIGKHFYHLQQFHLISFSKWRNMTMWYDGLFSWNVYFQMKLSGHTTARWRPKPRRPELRTVSVMQTSAVTEEKTLALAHLHLLDITDLSHNQTARISVLTLQYTAERTADTRHKVRETFPSIHFSRDLKGSDVCSLGSFV